MIIGTAGHIDHGKTTLVKALTGIDCDRLKEEKDRGITVDLGYAYSPNRERGGVEGTLGFIDVPGHEKLVHNMLAGATGIDYALLVVAADDGPMPQTREHLEIVELLSIRRGAVALTKTDLVDAARLAEAEREIRALLAGTSLFDAPVFPVDALGGNGIDDLREALHDAARSTGERPSHGRFRMAIDRCFTLSGIGTVVTGTAFSGQVSSGEALTLSPSGKAARVRSLRVQDCPADTGRAGQRIALALAGVEKSDVSRGMWLLDLALHQPQARFSAQVRVLSGQPILKHWMPVHCHLGADDIPGRIALLEGDELPPGQSALAEIVLERDISVIGGDRFILRDASARHTLGGGQVLDIFPPARRKRSPERLALLHALAGDSPDDALLVAATQQAGGADLLRFALNRNISPPELSALIARLGLKAVGDTAFSTQSWQALGERLCAALADDHTRSPDMPGVERDRLRRMTLPSLSRAALDILLQELLSAGRVGQTGAWIHLPEHRVQLAAKDRDLWLSFRPLLDASPYNPPRVRDIAQATGIAENTIRQTLKRMARVGEVYPVALDHYFTATAVSTLAQYVIRLCERDGVARAASLRDEIGGGRKVAIHILEFFDRIGFTRRIRDTHALRSIPGQGALPFGAADSPRAA